MHNVLLWCILKPMRYTFKQFKEEYPDDQACLNAVLENRYGDTCPRCGVIGVKFHPITGRQGFVCSECDKHIYPLADTIFRKSTTSLWSWFYAIYLFSVAKNGVSAKELERHLGVTYKTAWRMAKQIRLLMQQDDDDKLDGIVEADEVYIGGKTKNKVRYQNKTAVMGAVERYGRLVAQASPHARHAIVTNMIHKNVELTALIMTDESKLYHYVRQTYKHEIIRHSDKEYVRGNTHTNSIEGFWGNMRRSFNGTYHYVSQKYMQSYVDEFVFRYNFRSLPLCPVLLERVGKPSRSIV